MKTLKLDISNLDDHLEAARELIDFAGNERIFTFDAPMGSGKTTFIKSLCRQLSVIDTMSSPTYSIVNEYYTSLNLKLFHFDLYRLKSPEELFELGFEEYISSGNYVFIEWPELAADYLSSFVKIIIETEGIKRYLTAEIITT